MTEKVFFTKEGRIKLLENLIEAMNDKNLETDIKIIAITAGLGLLIKDLKKEDTMPYKYTTDYGKDLLRDINEIANSPNLGINAVVKDCFQRAYRRIKQLEQELDDLKQEVYINTGVHINDNATGKRRWVKPFFKGLMVILKGLMVILMLSLPATCTITLLSLDYVTKHPK